MVRLALKSALSDRAASERVVVVDEWNFELPKTKTAVAALEALDVEGRVLIVVNQNDSNTWKSFANLDRVHVISPGELNAYDVLVNDWVVFTKSTLPDAISSGISEDATDESSQS